MESRRLIFFSSLAIFFFAASAVLSGNLIKPALKIDKQNSALNFSNQFLKIGFSGYKRLAADVLWITTLLESDLEHYNNKDLNNWMFLRFNSISELDPLFLQNYIFGSQYLSIIKDDIEGSKIIFEKGLRQYPNNYHLIFNAAFLYAFELGDPQKALPLYRRLRKFPQRPRFLESLIAKLEYKKTGDLETAFQTLSEIAEDSRQDSLLLPKIEKDLYAIKAMIDLKCLNDTPNKNCSRHDYKGQPYMLKGSVYTTKEPFSPYKIHKKKGDD